MKAKQRLAYLTELQSKLNNLYKELNNAVKRFRSLSQIAKSHSLVSFYQKKLEERNQFRLELKTHLKRNDAKIESSGTVTGALSRLHAKIKVMFDNDDDQVSLTKATYHEESLLHVYQFVLRKPQILDEGLIKLLKNHVEKIESDIRVMRTFES
tara:strand:+ start:35820 stop:36281 length:462 start_codon:yes stop_codon:yes gene_type:complete